MLVASASAIEAAKSRMAAAAHGDECRLHAPVRLRILSTALITAGLVVLADVGADAAWKEPVSAIYGAIQQGQAEDELDDSRPSSRPPADLAARSRRRRRRRAQARGARRPLRATQVETGERDRPDRDRPRSASTWSSSQGTDTATLQKGPATTRDTPLPGQGRTIGDRRPPDHLPGAVPRHRRDRATATRSRSRCPTRPSPTGREARDRRPERRRDRRPRRLRAARAHRLPPALQRRAALRRLREADRDQRATPPATRCRRLPSVIGPRVGARSRCSATSSSVAVRGRSSVGSCRRLGAVVVALSASTCGRRRRRLGRWSTRSWSSSSPSSEATTRSRPTPRPTITRRPGSPIRTFIAADTAAARRLRRAAAPVHAGRPGRPCGGSGPRASRAV